MESEKNYTLIKEYLDHIVTNEELEFYGIEETLYFRILSKYYHLLSEGENRQSIYDTSCREKILSDDEIREYDNYSNYLGDILSDTLGEHILNRGDKKLFNKYDNFINENDDDNTYNNKVKYVGKILLNALKKYKIANKNFILNKFLIKEDTDFLNFLQKEYFKNIDSFDWRYVSDNK